MKQTKRYHGWLPAISLALLTALTLALAGCGSSSKSETPSKTTATGSLTSTGGNSGASALTVSAPAGVTLSIPANTTFTDAGGNPVSGSIATSVAYSTVAGDLPAAAATLPAGTTLVAFADVSLTGAAAAVKNFSQPVALGIQIPAASAAAGDALVVYSFNGSAWSFAGTELVGSNGVIAPSVSQLSVWGVF